MNSVCVFKGHELIMHSFVHSFPILPKSNQSKQIIYLEPNHHIATPSSSGESQKHKNMKKIQFRKVNNKLQMIL